MEEIKIMLTQIENTDLGEIRGLLDAGFSKLLDDQIVSIPHLIEGWFNKTLIDSSHWFAIRAAKKNNFKHFLVGFCGINDVDWVARHGKLNFVMVDRDGHKATMQNHPSTRDAVAQILDFAFNSLNLNKVWIEILENNDSKDTLEYFGFVADGIRRSSVFKSGKFINSLICSLTLKEYRAPK